MTEFDELETAREDAFAAAEAERERQREEELLASLSAEKWAFETGAK